MKKQKITVDEMGEFLCNAALRNSIDDVKIFYKLINNLFNKKDVYKILNYKKDGGYTPLISAALRHDHEVLSFLLEKQVDVSLINDEGRNFIDVAFIYNTGMNDFKALWKEYKFQKKIFEKDENLILSFVNRQIPIHPDIKKEYPHIVSGVELNLI